MSDGAFAGGGARQRGQGEPWVRRGVAWLAWWVVLTSLWLLLVASVSIPELLAGSAAAAIGATLVELVEYQANVRFAVRAEWLVPLAAVPGKVVVDTGLVLAALWRQAVLRRRVVGRFHVVPLDPGGEDPGSVARRALLTVGHSLAPNTIVLGIDREQGLMLVHHLVPAAQPEKDERPMDAERRR